MNAKTGMPTQYLISGETMAELLCSLRTQVYSKALAGPGLDKAAELLGVHPATLRRWRRRDRTAKATETRGAMSSPLGESPKEEGMATTVTDKQDQGEDLSREEMFTWIASASYKELLTRWRHYPTGSPFFQGSVGRLYLQTMMEKRFQVGEEEHVAISKAIGWRDDRTG